MRRRFARRPYVAIVAAGVMATLGACQPTDGAVGRAGPDGDTGAASTVVDSIRPMEDEMARFRATLTEHPERLSGGAATLDGLVGAFVDAVNRGDAAALQALALSRSEFAYFHYPYTHYTRPPYELSSALVWYRTSNRSAQGLTRVLRTFEGRELRVERVTCAAPASAGSGVVHSCTVSVRDVHGRPVEVRLFGPVLERDGRFKLLSLANQL